MQEGVLAVVEIHNYIVTFLTPKCNLCNLGDYLGASPLNSLNLSTIESYFVLRAGMIRHEYIQYGIYHTIRQEDSCQLTIKIECSHVVTKMTTQCRSKLFSL